VIFGRVASTERGHLTSGEIKYNPYTGNQNAARFLPVKYHMLALLHAPEARSNFMEGIGSRATIFELEGLGSEKRKYLRWLLAQSVAPKAVVKALLNRRE
jgi:hypothetical protein